MTENPHCRICGRHLGIRNHDASEHAEALEKAIQEAMN